MRLIVSVFAASIAFGIGAGYGLAWWADRTRRNLRELSRMGPPPWPRGR